MSEPYKAEGEILRLHDAVQLTETFRKREFVLELPDKKYPQPVLFQVIGDRCDAMNEFKIGDTLEVEFNIRGRFWDGPKGEKCFVSLDVWKMNRTAIGATPAETSADIPF